MPTAGTRASPTRRRAGARGRRPAPAGATTAGRDAADIEWGVGVEPEDLARFLAEDAETYVAMGFSQFTLGFDGPDWDVDAGTAWLAWRDRANITSAAGAA